jgi:hypothetical protein
VHEQQIDVGGVVELAAAPLTERDHRDLLGSGGRRNRGRPACVGDVGDLVHHLVERRATEVSGGDADHGAAAEPAETCRRAERLDIGGDLRIEVRAAARGRSGEQTGSSGYFTRKSAAAVDSRAPGSRSGRRPGAPDRARGGVGADAFPGGVSEHRVGRGGERALEVHAERPRRDLGPRSLLGGWHKRTGSERPRGSVTDLGRPDRALDARGHPPLVHAPELVDVGFGTVGADAVPVVMAVAGVDLAPERRVAGPTETSSLFRLAL